jgi:hypothetical protein
MLFLDQLTSVKGTRSLDNIFIFREYEKRLNMDFEGVPFLKVISKSQKNINQNQGEWPFFKTLVPRARKRVKLMPENTLLVI